MKKTRRLVLLVIGVAALSAASIGYSNAKYRKEVNLPDTARLAQWRVDPHAISGNLDLFSASYSGDACPCKSFAVSSKEITGRE